MTTTRKIYSRQKIGRSLARIDKTGSSGFVPLGLLENKFLRKQEIQFDFNLIQDLVTNEDALFKQEFEPGLEMTELFKVDEIKKCIDQLHDFEKYSLILFLIHRKRQKAIGRLLGIHQVEACYYKKRAIEKIRRLLVLNTVDMQKLEEFVKQYCKPRQALYFIEYWKCPNSRLLMHKLNVTSTACVLTGMKRALDKLKLQTLSSNKETAERASFYVNTFTTYIKGRHNLCETSKTPPSELNNGKTTKNENKKTVEV